MNYEKKYKEALEKARQFSEQPLQEDSSSIVEYIFPELQESEDEKIRKWLIDWAKAVNWSEQFTISKEQVLAWLEKQGKRDARYENLEELLEADTIYQMAMNDAMVEEAKTKAMNALSELEIGKLLGIEKQKKPEDMVHIAECKVWPANSATTANRQIYNRAILKLLSNYVEKYPDIRFGQMLCNLDVNPHFDQESRETYCNLNEIINKQK